MTSGGIATEKKLAANLHHCKGDGAAVGRAAASSQLVEYDQRTASQLLLQPNTGAAKYRRVHVPAGGVAKDGSGFKHLHHEGALAQHNFVACSYTSEHSVDNRQPATHPVNVCVC